MKAFPVMTVAVLALGASCRRTSPSPSTATSAPTAPPSVTAQDKPTDLHRELIASLQSDLATLRSGSNEGVARAQQLAQAIDILMREKPGSYEASDSYPAYRWHPIVLSHGSEKSITLATRYLENQRTEEAESKRQAENVAEETARRIAANVLQAKTARELEPALQELTVLPEKLSSASRDPNSLLTQLQVLKYFVSRWQSQLSQRESGDTAGALRTLRDLRSASYNPLPKWIDRTRFLDALDQAAIAAGQPSAEELDTTIRQLAEKALASTKPTDLDPLLEQGRKLTSIREFLPDSSSSRVYELESFIKTIQDFLIAKERGETTSANNSLSRLRTDGLGKIGIPRSRLLEYVYVAEGSLKKEEAPTATNKPGMPAPTPEEVAARMTTLETIRPNLPALRLAIDSLENRIQSGWALEPSQLEMMAKRAENLNAGQGFTRAVHENGLKMTSVPAILELQRQFDILCLHVAFAEDSGLLPQPKESPKSYISRLMPRLVQLEKWESLQTLYTANRAIKVQETPFHADDDAALSSFLYGIKLSTEAKDLRMATCAFQSVLTSPSKLVPASVVGKRLDAIRSSDPKAYREGCELALNISRAEGKRAPGERVPALQWVIPARKPK
jgi:hypothetical protein